MEKQSPLDMVMSVVKKAKLQAGTIVAFVLSLISMMLPWFKLEGADDLKSIFGTKVDIDTDVSFWESSDLLDLVVFVATVAGLVATGYVMYLVYKNSTKTKVTLGAIVVSAGAAALNVILGLLHIMIENDKGINVAYGFYFFALLNLVVAGLNGMKAYQNKAAVKELAGEVRSEAEKKMDKMKDSADSKPEAPATE